MKWIWVGVVAVLGVGLLRVESAAADCYPSNPEGTFPSLDAFARQFGAPCLNSPFSNPLVPYVPVDQFTGQAFQLGQGRPAVTNGVRQAETTGFWTGSSVEVQRNGGVTTTIRDSNGAVLVLPR